MTPHSSRPAPPPGAPRYLPRATDHTCKKRKIVNCGAVGFSLQTGRASDGSLRHRIDPGSISVIYGGFAAK